MKKLFILFSALFLAVAIFSFSACDKEQSSLPQEDSSDTPKTTCTVTFDSDSGQDVKVIEVEKGSKLNEPERPNNKTTKTYEYEFSGWFNGDTEWNFETDSVSGDLTLKAKWEIVGKYTKPVYPKK